MKPVHVKKARNKKNLSYLLEFATFDCETSNNHEEDIHKLKTWMHQWAFYFCGELYEGRTPSEFVSLCQKLTTYYDLSKNKRIVIFVHNLSYDLTYFYQWFYDYFDEVDMLAVKSRRVLSCRFDGIEFRCSYLLSNMSLWAWCNKLQTKHKKAIGSVDYSLISYQDEKLSTKQNTYQQLDVIVQHECIVMEMEISNDDITTIPLTSTGYVRRDVRNSCRKDKKYRKFFQDTALSKETYSLCRYAFIGGMCLGNRHFAGKVVQCKHRDFKSHYPSRQQLNYFPISKFDLFYTSNDGEISSDTFNYVLNEFCCIIEIVFENLRLREEVTAPYLSESKIVNSHNCKFYKNTNHERGTLNGRVYICEGNAYIVCTEIDLKWILDQYETDGIFIKTIYYAKRGKIPKPIRDVVNEYFMQKEQLEDGIYRDKSKNKLNGIYGMTATNPVRPDIKMDNINGIWEEILKSDEETEEELKKYYNGRNNFNPFQFGVYCTAHARNELMYIIKNIIGYENFVYMDTDSAFYISNNEIEKRIEKYNEWVIEENKKNCLGVINRKGNMSYYGTFEEEHNGRIIDFKFLHAKCYAYNDEGKLHVTIAGVVKSDPVTNRTNADELKSIDNLEDGFIFREFGGTTARYVWDTPHKEKINGHIVELAGGCVIENTTKEIGATILEEEFYM